MITVSGRDNVGPASAIRVCGPMTFKDSGDEPLNTGVTKVGRILAWPHSSKSSAPHTTRADSIHTSYLTRSDRRPSNQTTHQNGVHAYLRYQRSDVTLNRSEPPLTFPYQDK
jgi:hypothetical protein